MRARLEAASAQMIAADRALERLCANAASVDMAIARAVRRHEAQRAEALCADRFRIEAEIIMARELCGAARGRYDRVVAEARSVGLDAAPWRAERIETRRRRMAARLSSLVAALAAGASAIAAQSRRLRRALFTIRG